MKVIQDGEWKYQIATENLDLRGNLPISRTNLKGGKESWFKNEAKGTETVVDQMGVKTIKTWFVSGQLRGLRRQIVQEDPNGKKTTLYKAIYDEKGKLLREEDGFGRLFKYSGGNFTTEIMGQPASLLKTEYVPNTDKFTESYNNGLSQIKFNYNREEGIKQSIEFPDGSTFKISETVNNVKKRTFPDGKTETLQFDAANEKLLAKEDRNGNKWKYVYQDNTLIETWKNDKLFSKLVGIKDSQKKATAFYDSKGIVYFIRDVENGNPLTLSQIATPNENK